MTILVKTTGLRAAMATAALALGSALLLAAVPADAASPAPPATPSTARPSEADRLHAAAVAAFRRGRFAEAYGRFVELANVGHPASARLALWMCEHGPVLFDSQWDCAPHEVDDWALSAGVARPQALPSFDLPARHADRVAGRPTRR